MYGIIDEFYVGVSISERIEYIYVCDLCTHLYIDKNGFIYADIFYASYDCNRNPTETAHLTDILEQYF